MNSYIKYGPLLYTYNTRWKNIKNVFRSTFLDIGFGATSLLYLYLTSTISLLNFLVSLTLFVVLFYLYYIFYEIGYIHNDIIVIKKEKKPTIRVNEKLSNSFVICNILIRVAISGISIMGLYYLNTEIASIYIYILIGTLIVFGLHNTIRNYFRNFITFLGLRFLKFSIIFVIFRYLLKTWDSSIYFYATILFLLMQFGLNLKVYNIYYGGNIKYPETLMLIYMFISCLIFWGLTNSFFFVLYAIIYLVLFIVETPKEFFTLKKTR